MSQDYFAALQNQFWSVKLIKENKMNL